MLLPQVDPLSLGHYNTVVVLFGTFLPSSIFILCCCYFSDGVIWLKPAEPSQAAVELNAAKYIDLRTAFLTHC